MSALDLMVELWGEKCPQFNPECPACQAWATYEVTGMVPLVPELEEA